MPQLHQNEDARNATDAGSVFRLPAQARFIAPLQLHSPEHPLFNKQDDWQMAYKKSFAYAPVHTC